MKKIIGVVLLVLILAATAGLGYFLYAGTPKSGTETFAANLEHVQEMKALDAGWSLAALTAYNTPQSNFDAVAAFLPKVRDLRAIIEGSSMAGSDAPETLKNKLLRFLLLVEGKEVAIEHFKSNFAVVRNSLKFLPLATQTLNAELAKLKDKTLVEEISNLTDRVYAFLQNPDEGSKVRLLIDISKMEEGLMKFPAEVANPLANFTSHARVLVERKIELDASVQRLTEQEVVKAADELVALYKDVHRTEVAAAQARQMQNFYISLGLAVLVALLGVISAWMLWGRDREFDQLLAAGIAEKTEQYENAAAEASSSMVDKNLGDNIEGMGRMAATVAHEINTPLGYLGSNLQVLHNGMEKMQTLMSEFDMLQKDLNRMTDVEEITNRLQGFSTLINDTQEEAMLDELPEIADDMNEGIQQIQHVIDELKDFTRKDRSSQDWFDIKTCVESALKMSQKEIPENTQVNTDLADVPELYGTPAEINQVLINLINNAAQAIADAGRDKGVIKIKTSLDKGKVMVSVMDNGTGFDEETRSKIFDPFFTTKDVGKGTGLGLAIVRRIITTHGGKVLVKSVPGKGTNFVFVLPVKEKATEAV